METAIYGRMELGRCVKVDMGYLGCKNNVIDIVDEKCSGRTSCEIGIPDAMLEKTRPCVELKSYLKASYTCLKGRLAVNQRWSPKQISRHTALQSRHTDCTRESNHSHECPIYYANIVNETKLYNSFLSPPKIFNFFV